MKVSKNTPLKINLGCASRLLPGYINIDTDSLESIKVRYPNVEINTSHTFLQGNFFELDFEEGTIDEIRADSLIEHLSFKEEKEFFLRCSKLLKPNGLLYIETPDFEWTVQTWIKAKDDWQDFYRDDDEAIESKHWFGTYSYGFDNRWGYLMASIFGPQNGEGQFHKNAYTEDKFISIFKKLGFSNYEITRFRWKDDRDLMLKVKAYKNSGHQ